MMAGVSSAVNQQRDWSTRVSQCSVPSTTEDCLCGLFCCPCAFASAKSTSDNTSACYDFLCWNPIANRNYVRHEYGIPGVCGDDLGYTMFCPFCVGRQILTESKLRGRSQQRYAAVYGANTDRWNISLFDCDVCNCLSALVCPCCITADIRVLLQPSAAQDGCINHCCIMPTAMYGQVRNHYGIVSDVPFCEDVFMSMFCYPCAIIRAKKEAVHRVQIEQQQQQQRLPGPVQGLAQMFGRR